MSELSIKELCLSQRTLFIILVDFLLYILRSFCSFFGQLRFKGVRNNAFLVHALFENMAIVENDKRINISDTFFRTYKKNSSLKSLNFIRYN